MILADTSVWVDHLNHGDPNLDRLLRAREILIHPFVLGEMALGSLPDRKSTLKILRNLPLASVAQHEEVLRLIEDWALFGCGIGYLDAHLLAAVLLTPGTRLWTRNKHLRAVSQQLSLDARLA